MGMDNLDYGVIGNCKSAALVSRTGSIDWCCLPDFNSSSIFAAILDEEQGGCFKVEVTDDYTVTQKYVDRTNILCTRFSNGSDVFEVMDFMPRYKTDIGYYYCPPEIIRLVKHISGAPRAVFRFIPRLGYGQHETYTRIHGDYIKSSTTNGTYESIYLYSDQNPQVIMDAQEIEIREDHWFVLSYNQKLGDLNWHRIRLEYDRTEVYWLNWLERTISFTQYQEEIFRSALVLKLLTYHKSGAILAAVTTSLPETIGEVRNWDYRFCWIRDASMAISILTTIGHYNSAKRFLNFIVNIIPFKDDKIQIMYGIRGEKELTEKELTWLSGYENSSPVRVGNAAYQQKQNDIYGVLVDVIHHYFRLFRHTFANSEDLWTIIRTLLRTVAENWQNPDKGIWEIRSQERHFTFSKVLCWVAMDRGVKIAEILKKDYYVEEWSRIREEIKQDIHESGWNDEVGAFTQYYGSTAMDASNLLMEAYEFIDAQDPRYVSTVLKTKEELSRDGLMYRYKNQDDFGFPSSSFTVCTFWMIKSLCKIGRKEEAREMFDKILTYSNHLGLYSEDIDFKTKRLLGNFPQGYSHLALIDTAMVLSDFTISQEQQLESLLKYPFAD